jgi:hypothetical protein
VEKGVVEGVVATSGMVCLERVELDSVLMGWRRVGMATDVIKGFILIHQSFELLLLCPLPIHRLVLPFDTTVCEPHDTTFDGSGKMLDVYRYLPIWLIDSVTLALVVGPARRGNR